MYNIFPWVFTILYIHRIQILKQIHTICTSNVQNFPLNFHYFVLSMKSKFSTSLDYLCILCRPSRFGTFIDFPLIFPKFLHSTNSNYSRHLPRWFIKIIHFSFIKFAHYSYGYIFKKKKHKNHVSAITAPMLKTVYAENSEQFLWENSEQF